MLQEPVDTDAVTPGELRARYEEAVADAVAEVGAETAAEETGVDAESLAAAGDGDAELTVEEAARALALAGDGDADAILAEVRDQMMLSMSTAVLDVEAIVAGVEGDLSAREVQAKIEGRLPMTLGEYARIRHYVESEQ